MIDTGQRSFQRIWATKKSLGQKPQGRRNPPWYHLASHASSRKRPWGVQTHSCAVTCAHVVTYAGTAVGHATPRPCSPSPSRPLLTTRGSLRCICLGTLLFIVFWLSSFRLTGYQFKRERRKSQQENLHRKSDICGRFLCGCTRETKICRIREFFQKNGRYRIATAG